MKQLLGLASLCVSAAAFGCGSPPAPGAPPPAQAAPAKAPPAAATRPAGAAALRGPFGSVDALCETLEQEHAADREQNGTCRLDGGDWDVPADGRLVLDPPPAGYRAVRVAATEALDITCHLLVETEAGWFLGPGLPCGSERSRSDQEMQAGLEPVHRLHGAGTEIRMKVHLRSTYEGRSTDHEWVLLCGLGDRARPWCADG